MNDLNVIDSFMASFTTTIDSGFGLLSGDVATLTTLLIGIDITLAGLFWTLDQGADIVARLLRKVLYVGVFAYILNNFAHLADIVFRSFATLGLKATATGLSVDDLLKPGKLAGIGFQAAYPLLQQIGKLLGFVGFFDNFLTIAVLLIAWLIVIVAFFILSVQLFITILEFKLTALAGFVLVPFALWNKTAFLAERVLGNVISSGIKVMVLAVIVGIGSSFFGQFTAALNGQDPTIAQAMSLVLASLALFGLGIFGPAIASGLVSGAPQLGAGAAIGTLGGVAGAAMLAGGAVAGGARLLGAAGVRRAGGDPCRYHGRLGGLHRFSDGASDLRRRRHGRRRRRSRWCCPRRWRGRGAENPLHGRPRRRIPVAKRPGRTGRGVARHRRPADLRHGRTGGALPGRSVFRFATLGATAAG